MTIVLFVLLTSAIAVFVAVAAPSQDQATRMTDAVLAEARNALIGRAAMDDDRPGSLPCPDSDGDGIADLFDAGNQCPSYIGRLPWKTLGLSSARDASGEIIWYALSPTFRDHPVAQPINSVDTPALITVSGPSAATDVVAVLIAPGPVLPGQSREGAGTSVVSNYLEGDNATAGDNSYQTAAASGNFNDRVLAITRDQLFDVVEWRVASELRTALRRYYAAFHFYPFASPYGDDTFSCTDGTSAGRIPNADLSPSYPLSLCTGHGDWQPALSPPIAPPAWFAANGWHRLTYYAPAPACTQPTPDCSGAQFLTVNARSGVQAVVIVGGRAIAGLGQTRPCATAPDCIEQPLANVYQYSLRPRSASFNDRVAGIVP